MTSATHRRSVLVTGATGFVGEALVPALLRAGYEVRATTRRLDRVRSTEVKAASPDGAPECAAHFVECDVQNRAQVETAMEGVEAAYFLVHSMGGGHHDYAAREERAARLFTDSAQKKGVERIVYLGGVAPRGKASDHLRSRLRVGEVLRSGAVPTLELRASMIVGHRSASWQILRDLAMRLPAMVLPAWTLARTCPIALEDVVEALVRALELPLPSSAWYDIPGPEALSGRELLFRLAALRGRRVPSIGVPLLSTSLSSWWLRLVTRVDFALARELVLGFTGDLLPQDDRYWSEVNYRPRFTFEAAARKALDEEPGALARGAVREWVSEALVQWVGPKLPEKDSDER